MRFFHYHAGTVSRSTGRSCVQAVAYATRDALFEERRGIHANYTHAKKGDIFWETLSPEGSGIDPKDLSIWNKLDLAEDRILTVRHRDPEVRQRRINSARTAYDDEFALPKELTMEQNIELVRDYVNAKFVSKNLVATYSIHFEEGNPHVHVIYSARPFINGAFSKSKSVSRELRGPSGVRGLRETAAHTINRHQEMAGLDHRVDPRSYQEQQTGLMASRHKGWKAHNLERDGEYSRISEENRQIFEENKERVSEAPGIILKELTSTQATFSATDVMRVVQNRFKGDLEILGEHVFHNIMEQAVQVGENIYGQTRYTTPEYHEKESRILQSLEAFQAGKSSVSIDPCAVDAWIGKLVEEGQESANNKGHAPNAGQVEAIRALCGDSQLMVMVGRAGTGKTTTLKSVVRLHQEAEYDVWGMAPSATAAAQLEADTGCRSDTLTHYAYYWKQYESAQELLRTAETPQEVEAAQRKLDKCAAYLPDDRTVIIVDEAGMVGVGDAQSSIPGGWDALVKILEGFGGKLILVGDDHQYKPVEAGDIFRRLVHQLKGTPHLCELSEIVRQRIPWMREASQHLADLNVVTALGMYEQQGHVEAYGSSPEVYGAIARQYVRNMLREPDSSGFVVAATHEEIRSLNREIRSLLRDNGFLPPEDAFTCGEDRYAVGDKILFTKNDRGWNTAFTCRDDRFFVRNGMAGVIQSVKSHLTENADGGKEQRFEVTVSVPTHGATVSFFLDEYSHFTHGYAGTGHKSQGATLDWVLVKLSRYMDAHALYVTLTRHREDITLYYAQDQFPDYKSLVNGLSRANVKDLVVDYTITEEHEGYWQTVQEYNEACRERLAAGRLINSLDKTRDREEIEGLWQAYRDIQEDQKSLASCILRDWEEHKDFVRQSGLTRESLEIVAGVKKRSLSRLETQALLTVEQYVSTAFQCRTLWRDIRRTHPGLRAKEHPEWERFEETRNQRGILANQICLAPALHFPFLKETAGRLQKQACPAFANQAVSWSRWTVQAQAEAHQSKILQEALMRDGSDIERSNQLRALKTYTEHRDMAGILWKELRPKLKSMEGTLLGKSFEKEIDEFASIRRERDAAALKIADSIEAFVNLAEKVGIKIDTERLAEQAKQGKCDQLVAAWTKTTNMLVRLESAHHLKVMMKEESGLEKKPMTAHIFQQGMQPRDIARDALEWQKIKLFESLKTQPERDLFLLLDEYGDKCRAANELYAKCAADVKDRPDSRPWHSAHYGDYKAACERRNDNAIEVFDQRDHSKVVSMAESMGIRFKDVDLAEIFLRCEQATRTRHINAYLKAETPESKGEAAVALRQMIAFERNPGAGVPAKGALAPYVHSTKSSVTAQQVFYSGIEVRELQAIAFAHGRSCVLKGLSSGKEVEIYHALEAYENASRPASRAYKESIEESREKSTKTLEVKPWETEKFKEYISLITIQDEKAHELVKRHDAGSVFKIAKQMGISPKKLDVEAHRHYLRQTLQTFMDGDRTNVPMAAHELLNWLAFDRHGDHKHTFKVLREQDFWPNAIQESLQAFIGKKREWRHEERHGTKDAAKAGAPAHSSKPEYKTIIHERRQSFDEIDKELKDQMFELATHILGNPTSRTSTQLRFGKKGSVCVFTNGPKQGLYANHETGVYGGPLKLIEEKAGVVSPKEARDWATDWLGGKAVIVEQRVVEKAADTKQPEWIWTPIVPVPRKLENPDIEGDKYLSRKLKDGGKVDARYAYRDEDGNLLGYVIRIVKSDGTKEIPPLAWCHGKNSGTGKEFDAWQWKGFFTSERTPYGLEKLTQNPTKPVLAVEGEKTADAAQKLLPEYNVLTWLGGAGNVGRTNWQCLVGKEVVIWPDYDYDQKGQMAAEKLRQIVTKLNRESRAEGRVGIVALPPLETSTPPLLPDKWDLADKLPEGWTLDTVRQMVKDAVQVKEKSYETTNGVNAETVLDGSLPPAPAYTPDDQKILAYLKSELSLEKNPWLDKDLIDTYTKAAEKNPADMLKRWQEITDDFSFIPCQAAHKQQGNMDKTVPHGIFSHTQETGLAKDPTSGDKKSLAYLKNELSLEKNPWLDKDLIDTYTKAAEKNPADMLKRWQEITDNQSFNSPVQESTRPLTDQQQLAQSLIASVQRLADHKTIMALTDSIKHSPQDVIDKCNELIQQHKDSIDSRRLDARREIAAEKFIAMCKEQKGSYYPHPKLKALSQKIDEIAGQFLEDEKFVNRINNSGSKEAIARMDQAIQERERAQSRGHSLEP